MIYRPHLHHDRYIYCSHPERLWLNVNDINEPVNASEFSPHKAGRASEKITDML